MKRNFDSSLLDQEAAGQMLRLRQETRSAYDYGIEFRTLAASCGWNDCAIKDELDEAVKNVGNTLNTWKEPDRPTKRESFFRP